MKYYSHNNVKKIDNNITMIIAQESHDVRIAL